uniref:Uncharacterized protein n=1 Tax=Anopheles christyi TaxID=43041 RepID=A0A182K9I8_9DIPT
MIIKAFGVIIAVKHRHPTMGNFRWTDHYQHHHHHYYYHWLTVM